MNNEVIVTHKLYKEWCENGTIPNKYHAISGFCYSEKSNRSKAEVANNTCRSSNCEQCSCCFVRCKKAVQ